MDRPEIVVPERLVEAYYSMMEILTKRKTLHKSDWEALIANGEAKHELINWCLQNLKQTVLLSFDDEFHPKFVFGTEEDRMFFALRWL